MTEKQECWRAVAHGRSHDRQPLYGGLTVVAVGLAHFVRPGIFEPITRFGFPERPRTFTYINGSVETLIGVLIAVPQFRGASIVVTLCYGFHFGGNVIRSLVSRRRDARTGRLRILGQILP